MLYLFDNTNLLIAHLLAIIFFKTNFKCSGKGKLCLISKILIWSITVSYLENITLYITLGILPIIGRLNKKRLIKIGEKINSPKKTNSTEIKFQTPENSYFS